MSKENSIEDTNLSMTAIESLDDLEGKIPAASLTFLKYLEAVGKDFRNAGEDQDLNEPTLEYKSFQIWVRNNIQRSEELADAMASYLYDCYQDGRETARQR